MMPNSLKSGWKDVQLGQIADFVMGQAPPSQDCNSDGRGVPFVKAGEFGQERPVVREWTTKPLKTGRDGDVFICVVGATAGKLNLGIDCAIGRSVAAIRPRADILPEFLLMQLTPKVPELRAGSAGTAQGVISRQDLASIAIVLPSLAEQHRIVAKHDELTARSRRAKESLDAITPLLDKLRQSILAAAFRGDLTADWRAKNPNVEPADKLLARIRTERRARWEAAELAKLTTKGKPPVDDKWKRKYVEPPSVDGSTLPSLPSDWCWATAEELTAANRPIIYGIIKAGPDFPGGVPYVRVTEVAAGRIVLGELPRCDPSRAAKFSRSVLAAGDLLVSKDGTIGKVAVVPSELEGGNINQHVLRVAASPFVNRNFLVRMIESPQCQRWMTGETRGVALQGVNVEDFRRMPIPLPPAAEQIRVAEEVGKVLTRLRSVSAVLNLSGGALTDLTRSLLMRAFSGQLCS